jgi:hypothetical protein
VAEHSIAHSRVSTVNGACWRILAGVGSGHKRPTSNGTNHRLLWISFRNFQQAGCQNKQVQLGTSAINAPSTRTRTKQLELRTAKTGSFDCTGCLRVEAPSLLSGRGTK